MIEFRKSGQKKIRKLGYKFSGFLHAICDNCEKDCFKTDFYSAKKFRKFSGFGRGDDEQIECLCLSCLEKKSGKLFLKR